MGIVQVNTQMNLVHEELKAACTLELAHDVFTINAQEAFNENEPEPGFEETGSLPTLYSDDNVHEDDHSFTISMLEALSQGLAIQLRKAACYGLVVTYIKLL